MALFCMQWYTSPPEAYLQAPLVIPLRVFDRSGAPKPKAIRIPVARHRTAKTSTNGRERTGVSSEGPFPALVRGRQG